MMLPLELVAAHFIADFVLQNDWMAHNKSSRCWPLTVHVTIYSTVFLVLEGWQFAGVTFVLHWATDFVTSRVNSALLMYEKGRVAGINTRRAVDAPKEEMSHHWFFVGVGADQLLHYVALAYTYQWMNS